MSARAPRAAASHHAVPRAAAHDAAAHDAPCDAAPCAAPRDAAPERPPRRGLRALLRPRAGLLGLLGLAALLPPLPAAAQDAPAPAPAPASDMEAGAQDGLAVSPGVEARDGADDPIAQTEGASRAIVAALSQNRVSITANFSGSQIFVFGALKAQAAAPGPLEVVVTIAGPSGPVTVRRKERVAGIWINTDEVIVNEAPSFYAVASTAPLDRMMPYAESLKHRIGINQLVRLIAAPSEIDAPQDFREAVIRLRRDQGLYVELPGAVKTVEDTLFTVDVNLPANLVEGDYRARVFLVHEGVVLDRFETRIAVRKVGLERWVYALSQERPAVYGALSVIVALLAGWGASEAFRLLRS